MKLTKEQKDKLAPLVTRIKKGDEQAFAEFIERTQDSVFRFCLYLSKNREQADEYCQETYLKAMGQFKNLADERTAHDWLLRIAKNLFIDGFRRNKLENEFVSQNVGNDAELDAAAETKYQVKEALSFFEPEDRSLLILIDLEDYSYSEAAEVLGISEDAVRSRIHRARQLFLKYLKPPETKKPPRPSC